MVRGGSTSDDTGRVHDAGEQCIACRDQTPPPQGNSVQVLKYVCSNGLNIVIPTLKYAFMLELVLEDYTGTLNAYLVEEDAVR